MAYTIRFAQLQATTLAGAGAAIGDTSVILTSFTTIDGTLLTMSDFGSIGYATIEPNNGAYEEQISFTGITQNANGTATLTGVRTVSFITPYTSTSGLAKAHAGGTALVISNTSAFYQTIIDYIDGIAIAGSPDATLTTKGIVEMATTTEINAGTQSGSTGADLAVRPDQLLASIYKTQLPSADEKAALVGTGTPSVSNKFVTEDTIADYTRIIVTDYAYAASPVTWTKPVGLAFIDVEIWGGGGAGESGSGRGGGGGAYVKARIQASQLGATETITIGAGGTRSGSGPGGAGGNTTFGSLLTAYGGAGGSNTTGYSAGGGGGMLSAGTTASSGNGAGGSPVPGTNGEPTFGGGYGASAGANGQSSIYGGGGGAGYSGSSSTSGFSGGNSIYGGAGGGSAAGSISGTKGSGGTSKFGGNGGNGSQQAGTPATNGSVPGGGGGGSTNSGAGSGGNGQARITEYYI